MATLKVSFTDTRPITLSADSKQTMATLKVSFTDTRPITLSADSKQTIGQMIDEEIASAVQSGLRLTSIGVEIDEEWQRK